MSEERHDEGVSDDPANRIAKGCAATLGFFFALGIGCTGCATLGYCLAGTVNNAGNPLLPSELWMTALGALIGAVVGGAAYLFFMFTYLQK